MKILLKIRDFIERFLSEIIFFSVTFFLYLLSDLVVLSLSSILLFVAVVFLMVILLFFAFAIDILVYHWNKYKARGILLLLLLASFSNSLQNSIIEGGEMFGAMLTLLTVSAYLILDSMLKQVKSHLNDVNEVKSLDHIFLHLVYAYIFSIVTIPFYKFTSKNIGMENDWYAPVLLASILWLVIRFVRSRKKKSGDPKRREIRSASK